jgi:hypothetical protein
MVDYLLTQFAGHPTVLPGTVPRLSQDFPESARKRVLHSGRPAPMPLTPVLNHRGTLPGWGVPSSPTSRNCSLQASGAISLARIHFPRVN